MLTNQKNELAIYGRERVGKAVIELVNSLGISFDATDDNEPVFEATRYKVVIPSPGVPPRNRAYSQNNTISELDLAYRYIPEGFTIVAITGTDGKSTTAWVTYELLRKTFGDDQVFLSGNFDIPLSETVTQIRKRGLTQGYIVVEVSSFMANGIGHNSELLELFPVGHRNECFTPDYTIFTNFETDHVDWHGSIDEYFKAKMNLVQHTKTRVIAQESLQERAHRFGIAFPYITRWYGKDTQLPDHTDGAQIWNEDARYHLSETQLKGSFNAMNLLAALCITSELGISEAAIKNALPQITGLPHRLEFVAIKNGVTYIDDSKSTSAQSLKVALESYLDHQVILIAGGSDKWDSFDHLEPLFKAKLQHIICIGVTREKFAHIAQRADIGWSYADSMQEAVAKASQIANLGEVVLLSPGCASFGLFKNYLDRAHQFIESVQSIPDFHD